MLDSKYYSLEKHTHHNSTGEYIYEFNVWSCWCDFDSKKRLNLSTYEKNEFILGKFYNQLKNEISTNDFEILENDIIKSESLIISVTENENYIFKRLNTEIKKLKEKTIMTLIKKFKSNKNNSIKILKYEFTGGNDLDFNPLNGESLNGNDEYVGLNPTNQITFEVNGEKLYSKFIRIWDGPVTHGDYIFLSEDKEFENIDIFSNHDMIFQNLIDPNTIEESMENLPYVISQISILMTDEDFMEEYDEIGYIDYEPKELNVEIDYVKMINDYNSF